MDPVKEEAHARGDHFVARAEDCVRCYPPPVSVDIVLLEGPGHKVLGHCRRDVFCGGTLPESIILGGRVFMCLDESALDYREFALIKARDRILAHGGFPVAARYLEIGAVNFDASKAEGRSPIQWQEGCDPYAPSPESVSG